MPTVDIKKKVCARRQALRIKIESYKITLHLETKKMDFMGEKRITRDIERAERELAMLESQWLF